jgi:hypothetical protein
MAAHVAVNTRGGELFPKFSSHIPMMAWNKSALRGTSKFHCAI